LALAFEARTALVLYATLLFELVVTVILLVSYVVIVTAAFSIASIVFCVLFRDTRAVSDADPYFLFWMWTRWG